MNKRIITPTQRKIFETNWKSTKYPQLLNDLRRVNQRLWKVITENEFTPFTEELGSAYLFGKAGTGKSVQAVWRMLEWSRLKAINGKPRQSALFINLSNLLLEIKASYDNNNTSTETEIIEKYSTIEMLVIDDFGVVKTTEWVYQIIYIILENRYSNFKPTIITSNDSLETLRIKLNDERLVSRIKHDCKGNIFNFTGKSKR